MKELIMNVSMNKLKTATHLILLALLSLLIGACSSFGLGSKNSTGARGSFAGSPTCQNNAFLQKYGCSFDRIDAAARTGDPDAQYALGYLYFYGVGVDKNGQVGKMWIDKAAAQGQPLAIRAQRLMSQNGYSYRPGGGSGGGAYRDTSTDVSSLNSNKSAQSISSVLPGYGKKTASSTGSTTSSSSQAASSVSATKPSSTASSNVPASASSQTTSSTSTTKPVGSSMTPGIPATPSTKPTPAAPQAPLSSHLTPGEAHLLDVSSTAYTVQLMGSHNPRALADFVKKNGLSGAYYYASRSHDQNWYSLIYGTYPSKQAAEQAIKQLPVAVKKVHPWVKPMAVVQKEIKARQLG